MTRPYTEIIAHALHAAGWSYGDTSYTDTQTGARVYVADAHKERQRCVAKGEDLLTAYVELHQVMERIHG